MIIRIMELFQIRLHMFFWRFLKLRKMLGKKEWWEKKTRNDWMIFLRYLVNVSYLEIYNEEVRDLLGKDRERSLEVKSILLKKIMKIWFLKI
jgi:hypothetical protein